MDPPQAVGITQEKSPSQSALFPWVAVEDLRRGGAPALTALTALWVRRATGDPGEESQPKSSESLASSSLALLTIVMRRDDDAAAVAPSPDCSARPMADECVKERPIWNFGGDQPGLVPSCELQ